MLKPVLNESAVCVCVCVRACACVRACVFGGGGGGGRGSPETGSSPCLQITTSEAQKFAPCGREGKEEEGQEEGGEGLLWDIQHLLLFAPPEPLKELLSIMLTLCLSMLAGTICLSLDLRWTRHFSVPSCS